MAAIYGTLKRFTSILPNLNFSWHTVNEPIVWYTTDTDANGNFVTDLPDGDFIIEGIWVGELSEWNVINYVFSVRNGLLVGDSKLRLNAKPGYPEDGVGVADAIRAKVKKPTSEIVTVADNLATPNFIPGAPIVEVIETFEGAIDTWENYGNWYKTPTRAYNGAYSFRSAVISHNGTSTQDFIEVYVSDAALNPKLSFYYFTSTEAGWDLFRVYLNREETILTASGISSGWTYFEYPLEPNNDYTITFEYTKDGSVSTGEDAVFIDNLRISYSEGGSTKVQYLEDSLALTDTVTPNLTVWVQPTHGWDAYRWDQAYFDIILTQLTLTDTVSVADGVAKKVKDPNADTTTLSDNVNKAIKNVLADSVSTADGFKTKASGVFGDTGTVTDDAAIKTATGAAETVALMDAIQAKAKLQITEALSLLDALAAVVKTSFDDSVSLSDDGIPRLMVVFQEAVAVSDSILALYQAVFGDSVAVDDLLANRTTRPLGDDAVTGSDNVTLKAQPTISDTVALADAVAIAIAAYRSDILALADQLTLSMKADRADTLNLLDAIAAAVGKNDLDSATSLADDLAKGLRPEAVADFLGLADDFQLKAAPLSEDTAAVADAIVKKVQDRLDDLLALIDSARAKASDRNDDAAAPTDALAITTKRLLADTLTLTDDIARAYGTGVLTPGTFDFGRFDEATYDDAGDLVSLSDAIDFKTGYGTLGADLLALADAIQVAVKDVLTDSLTLSDSTAAKVKDVVGDSLTLADNEDAKTGKNTGDTSTVSDSASGALTMPRPAGDSSIVVSDSSSLVAKPNAGDSVSVDDSDAGKNIGPGTGDTTGVADTAAFSFKKDLNDLLALSDNLLRSVAAVVGDTLPVADQLALVVKAVAAEIILNVADDNKLKAMNLLGDLMTLSDAHLADIARIHKYVLGGSWDSVEWDAGQFDGSGDYIRVEDDYRAAVATILSEIIATNDAVKAKSLLTIADSESITDGLLNQLTKTAAEAMGVSDELLQLVIGLRKDTTLSLAELLSKRAGLPPDDSSTVADSIIAALTLARSADDLIAATDDTIAKVKTLLQDAAILTDSFALSTKRAVAEAIAIAEKLGLKTKRPVSSNGVGIIDELYLKYALGIAWDEEGVADSIRGKVKTILQQVFINGVSIPVNGLNIRHSGKDRVSTATFKIPSPTAEILTLAKQRAPVTIYLADGVGNTDYFGGRIVGNPTNARGSVTTEMSVTVDDWTAASLDVYVIESFADDFGTIDEALKYLWKKYYGYDIDLSKVVATDKRMPSMAFNYTPLFAVTEMLAQLLGWSWHVEYNGGGRVLQFYPPAAAVQPVTLSREARNVAAGTARFGQDETIANVVYVFGGQGISNPYTQRIVADGQNTIYKLGSKPHRIDEGSDGGVLITLVKPDGTRVPQRMGIMNLHEEANFDLLMDFNEATLRWRADNKPPKDWILEAYYRYTYPIMVQLTDDTSIAQYGRIEMTVNDSSIKDPVAARELGRAILRDRAYPKGFGSCEVFVPGLRAGQFITVDMPAYNAKGLFEITEIEKWIQGTTVRRRVTLNVADDAESRIAQRLKDFAKRLANLEAANRQEDLVVQRWLQGPARNIGAMAKGRVAGSIQDTVTDTTDQLQDDYILTWKTTGQSKTWAKDTIRNTDNVAKKTKPRKADTAPAADRISGGITFFDIHTFGDASHPWGL